MIINHNIAALNTHRQLGANNTNASKNLEKLSSGMKINRAGDDAAGLAISEKMRGQIRGLDMAQKNAQDSISLIQTAEGALNETHDILQRMRELAVQSSNDTNTATDRNELQKEVDQLAQEISRISNDTEFNTQNLAGGNFNGTFHIGSNSGQSINLEINAMDANSLGLARDGIQGKGADGIGDVKFDSKTGANLVDGANLTVKSTEVTAGKGTAAAVAGVTVETATNTDAYNGYTVTTADSTTEGIEIDHENKTIVISSDISNTATAADQLTVTHTNGSGPALTFTGTATAADTTGEEISGGAAKSGFSVAISDGTDTQNVFVEAGAKEIKVKSGEYEGLSFKLDAEIDDTLDGTIAVTAEAAGSATFNADGSVATKAVAPKGIDISTQGAADKAITTIQTAIDTVSSERSKLGAMQNRLEHTINNLGTSSENLTAAESRIRDVDMAKEMMEFTKNNILTQAAQAMLAQANQQPQGVLQLLR